MVLTIVRNTAGDDAGKAMLAFFAMYPSPVIPADVLKFVNDEGMGDDASDKDNEGEDNEGEDESMGEHEGEDESMHEQEYFDSG